MGRKETNLSYPTDQTGPTPGTQLGVWDLYLAELRAGAVPRPHGPLFEQIVALIRSRNEVGIARYGTPLLPNNRRSMIRDALDEAFDLVVYLRGGLEELYQQADGGLGSGLVPKYEQCYQAAARNLIGVFELYTISNAATAAASTAEAPTQKLKVLANEVDHDAM